MLLIPEHAYELDTGLFLCKDVITILWWVMELSITIVFMEIRLDVWLFLICWSFLVCVLCLPGHVYKKKEGKGWFCSTV